MESWVQSWRLPFLAPASFFFSLLLFSSLTLPTSAFPSVHIVGSFTSKLPSIIYCMWLALRFLLPPNSGDACFLYQSSGILRSFLFWLLFSPHPRGGLKDVVGTLCWCPEINARMPGCSPDVPQRCELEVRPKSSRVLMGFIQLLPFQQSKPPWNTSYTLFLGLVRDLYINFAYITKGICLVGGMWLQTWTLNRPPSCQNWWILVVFQLFQTFWSFKHVMIIPTSGGVEPAGMLLQQALYAADHFSERLWGWRIFDELEVKTSLGATALRWSVGVFDP